MRCTRGSGHDTKTAPTVCFPAKAGTSTSGGRRLGESSAALSTLMLGRFTFQAPLLSLFAARDTVRAPEVGGA